MTDRPAPSPAQRRPASPLEGRLASGAFVVTTEMVPPDSADPADFRRQLAPYRGCADAINVPDGPGANCHMSSLAAAALLAREGLQPIMQMCCRDRNVIAVQADILGAAALGVHNLLCLRGDDVANGDHAWARPVFELDSLELMRTAVTLSREGRLRSGRVLAAAPALFIGGAVNPFGGTVEGCVANFAQKVAAGARFVQSQYCFDVARLQAFMQQVRDQGLHERCAILVGVGLLPSARAARWMRQHIPGTAIPDALIDRLERSPNAAVTGVDICLELIEQVRAVPGVAGVHLMMHRHAQRLAEIVERAGLARQAPGVDRGSVVEVSR
ncbi:MAG: methylenetetrahydrofolate reductase [Gammaproteobacteria bacterium]|nr:methylenetetrahydrofolate reductase [Gammaproteobacteria bacterium]